MLRPVGSLVGVADTATGTGEDDKAEVAAGLGVNVGGRLVVAAGLGMSDGRRLVGR